MAITTENYLKDLIKQKENLVSTLQECGVEANNDEKFNTLVPKVKEIINAIPSYIISDSLTVVGDLSHDSLMSIINALKPLVTYEEVITEYPNASFGCVPADGSMWSLNKWYKIEGWYDGNSGAWYDENYECGFSFIGEDGLSWNFGLSRELYDELKSKNAEYWRGYSVANDIEGYGFAIKSTKAIPIDETKTLTLGATSLSKLTDEEKAIATNKGWVLA